jgi:hypothetical protein
MIVDGGLIMSAIAKRADERQGHHGPPVSLGEFTSSLPIPLPPEGISDDLRHKWGLLWTSPVAALFDPVTDRPAMARLFGLYELGARLDRLIAQSEVEGAAARAVGELGEVQAVAEGAAARQALNSTVGARMRVATETRMLEAQLGLSPRSRIALGLTVLAGKAAAAAGGLDSFLDD